MKKFILISLLVLTSCNKAQEVYTLYRTGINLETKKEDVHQRIHLATFDVNTEADAIFNKNNYNRANCEFAAELFNVNQPHYAGSIFAGTKIKYWCEKAYYK